MQIRPLNGASLTLHKILIADDLSDSASLLVEAAATIATAFESEVDLVHVQSAAAAIAPAASMGESAPMEFIFDQREAEKEILIGRTHWLMGHGVRAESHVIEGDPGTALVQRCREVRADLIVLGKHRRNVLGRLFLGSVAEAVVKAAPCPVLVVPIVDEREHLHWGRA